MAGVIGRTSLDDALYRKTLRAVMVHLSKEDRITNALLRELTGINYDQAIRFFNRAVTDGKIRRMGRASGTHYVLPRGGK